MAATANSSHTAQVGAASQNAGLDPGMDPAQIGAAWQNAGFSPDIALAGQTLGAQPMQVIPSLVPASPADASDVTPNMAEAQTEMFTPDEE